jgi:tRNA threonylcarbamoyladenosine biosynthesis protein TsaB
MILLGLDSAGAAASAALWRDGTIIGRRFAAMARGQAEALPLMVADLAQATGVDLARLDGIGVTVGPGSFTGIRIGLALARGFGLAAGAPVIGISSFLSVAHDIPSDLAAGRRLVVVLESKRAELYAQIFDGAAAPASDMLAVTAEALAHRLSGDAGPLRLVVAGDAADRVEPELARLGRDVVRAPGAGHADAAAVVALAARRLVSGDTLDPARPVYLRPPDVTMAAPSMGAGIP